MNVKFAWPANDNECIKIELWFENVMITFIIIRCNCAFTDVQDKVVSVLLRKNKVQHTFFISSAEQMKLKCLKKQNKQIWICPVWTHLYTTKLGYILSQSQASILRQNCCKIVLSHLPSKEYQVCFTHQIHTKIQENCSVVNSLSSLALPAHKNFDHICDNTI